MSNPEFSGRFAHGLQKSEVGGNGTPYFFIFYILNSIFLASILDDLTDCGVMNMRDLGK